MSTAREPPAREIEHSGQLYLPDFCTARAVLLTVIICELTALVLALARNEEVLGFWPDLGRTSMFLLWIGLCGAALLCVLRGYLNRQSPAKGSAIVLALTAGLVLLISAVTFWFGNNPSWMDNNVFTPHDQWTFLVRNVFIAVVVTALALRYFYVTHEWRYNVELQARARVHALQARIRPHFLFNSMNTIAALTRSNPARAEEAGRGPAPPFPPQLHAKGNQNPPARGNDRGRPHH